jgi:hypothetical protein
MTATAFVIALVGLVGIAAVAASIFQAPRVTVVATCKRFPDRQARTTGSRWKLFRQFAR